MCVRKSAVALTFHTECEKKETLTKTVIGCVAKSLTNSPWKKKYWIGNQNFFPRATSIVTISQNHLHNEQAKIRCFALWNTHHPFPWNRKINETNYFLFPSTHPRTSRVFICVRTPSKTLVRGRHQFIGAERIKLALEKAHSLGSLTVGSGRRY